MNLYRACAANLARLQKTPLLCSNVANRTVEIKALIKQISRSLLLLILLICLRTKRSHLRVVWHWDSFQAHYMALLSRNYWAVYFKSRDGTRSTWFSNARGARRHRHDAGCTQEHDCSGSVSAEEQGDVSKFTAVVTNNVQVLPATVAQSMGYCF